MAEMGCKGNRKITGGDVSPGKRSTIFVDSMVCVEVEGKMSSGKRKQGYTGGA
jgi:hypothetical protein